MMEGRSAEAAQAPHPSPPDAPDRGTLRREVEAMTVLAFAAAILEFASGLVSFLTVILERLPVRKDKEP